MTGTDTTKRVPNDFGPDTRQDFHVLKYQGAFAVFSSTGCMNGPGSEVPERNMKDGLFLGDTRMLSRLVLRTNRVNVIPMGGTVGNGGAVFAATMANGEMFDNTGRRIAPYSLHIVRERLLRRSLHERLFLTNYSAGPVDLDLTLDCWADFRDVFEVRGIERQRRGQLHPPSFDGRSMAFGYTTLDGHEMRTTLTFDRDFGVEGGKLHFPLRLEPGADTCIEMVIHTETRAPDRAAKRHREPLGDFEGHKQRTVDEFQATCDTLRRAKTNRPAFDDWLANSASDLTTLITDLDTGPFPYAGLPWFSAPFGRDALVTAMQTSWLYPDLARGVLDYLAATQADTCDPDREAAPGKILHEAREGEMARCGEVPFHRYYGGVDQTLLYVMLAEDYVKRTGDTDWLRQNRSVIDKALDWADTSGDRDGDGLIEYLRSGDEGGLRNQGWKDSTNAMFHADGRLAEGAIALVEVQAYHAAARRAASFLYRLLGDEAQADACAARADDITARLEQEFWDADLGAWVMGLDGDKEPMRVLSSNAGHVLFAGAATETQARYFAERCGSPDFAAHWGLRTVAEGTPRFNPMGYHTGSIWPHDTSMVVAGLCRYGEKRRAAQLVEGLFAASREVRLRGLPELYCGLDEGDPRRLVSYPSSCSPQAWAAGSPFLCLKALIGLDIDMTREGGPVTLTDPWLPDGVDRLTIDHLPLAGGIGATVEVERRGDDSFQGRVAPG